ncbi:hypothetical protein BGP80_09500 [Pseudomonas putida]|uniref:Uncharacterized protein n=1 Tax=Pseudomonas putida TaxID=303 RepID=A0A2S3WB78_PSEPU|nr:hypothetical protein BGP80_09500 [Pseudomonas putida]
MNRGFARLLNKRDLSHYLSKIEGALSSLIPTRERLDFERGETSICTRRNHDEALRPQGLANRNLARAKFFCCLRLTDRLDEFAKGKSGHSLT